VAKLSFENHSISFKLSELNYIGQQISKLFCICDEYVINLFVCNYESRKGT